MKKMRNGPGAKKSGLSLFNNESGFNTMAIVMGLSTFGVILGNALQNNVENANRGVTMARNQAHLQQGCTEALEQVSQLLGSGIINISPDTMKFVANSQLPGSIASEIVQGDSVENRSTARNWSINGAQGIINVRSCAEVELSNGEVTQILADRDEALPNQPCSKSKMLAAIKPEKVLDPAEDSTYAHLKWKTAVVSAVCTVGESKNQHEVFKAHARINFLPPSQICNFENEETSPYCSVDHCRYMTPLMVSDPEAGTSENKGDVYLEGTDADTLNLKLIPNPDYVAELSLPVPQQIPSIAAYLNMADEVEKPTELISFVKQSICAGLNNPFKGYQGVEGVYEIDDYFAGQRDANNMVRFEMPAYDQVDENQGDLVEKSMAFEGYLYYDSTNDTYKDKYGSLAQNWDVGLQRQNPEYHKELLKGGCSRTVGIQNADFCSRMRLTHAAFSYKYPKKRRCYYKGPPKSIISKNDYKEIINELDKDYDTSNLYDWEDEESYFSTSFAGWKETSHKKAGFYPISGQNSLKTYVDPVQYHHHTASETASISKEIDKVGHDFSGVIESQVLSVEVKNITQYYEKTCTEYEEPKEEKGKKDDDDDDDDDDDKVVVETPPEEKVCKTWGQGTKLTDEQVAGITEDTKDNYLSADSLMEREVTLTWAADCSDVIDTTTTEKIPIQDEAKAVCGFGDTNLKPVVLKKFDRCYYIAYYNSENRLGCTVGSPRAEGGSNPYECRNHNGCFAKGTPVLMADGESKVIETIVQGDFVMNPVTRQSSRVASVMVGPQKKPMLKLFYEDGKYLESTWNHPFLTPDGFKKAEALTVGDKIMLDSMRYAPLTKIENIPLDHERLVWNLVLEEDELALYFGMAPVRAGLQQHLFIANGVVTGDYYIQNLKDIDKKNSEFKLDLSRASSPVLDGPVDGGLNPMIGGSNGEKFNK